MPTLNDIIAPIEAAAPRAWQESWDNTGWQVCPSDPATAECTGALLTMDVTESVVGEAVRAGFNLIVSHHPLLFKGLKQITGSTPAERIVATAIKHDISIYSAHTNMDSAPGGVNFRLAEMLGLQNIGILMPQRDDRERNFGLGCVGDLAEAVPTADFLRHIVQTLNLPYLRHSEIATDMVRRVAVCGGSCAEFIPAAVAAGAQVYLTADLKYHDFQRGEGVITLADGGHFETEQQLLDVFYELISKKIPNFAVRRAEMPSNPVSYLSGVR